MISSTISSFPCIGVFVDAFGPLTDAVVEFQSSTELIIHEILPSLHYVLKDLHLFELGGSVVRDGEVVSQPSIYSMRSCRIMKEELKIIQDCDLW